MSFRSRASWLSQSFRASGATETKPAARLVPGCRSPLALEWLEDRTLFSVSPLASAVMLDFNAVNVAQAEHFLASGSEVDLYRVALQAGDTLEAGISAQDAGNQAGAGFTFTFPGFSEQAASGLSSLLRVFNSAGTPLAMDDQQGGDPSLTFQATTAGFYYVGVSSAPNDHYDPTVFSSIVVDGATTGLYTLGLRRISAGPLVPDVTGSSFRTGVDMAATGETVPVNFTVENRGGADPGNFQVQVLLANNNLFDSSAQVLATLPRCALVANANGRDFSSPTGFGVTLPAGLTSGAAFLGLRIVADPAVPEAGVDDKSGVHRGVDWEPLTVVTAAPGGVTDLSGVDADLNTQAAGTLGSNRVAAYSFTVSSTLGNGNFTAEVAATGGDLLPRLTLSGSNGQTLIQSYGGDIEQSLTPGTYFLTVSSQASTGAYRLDTAFVESEPPLEPLPSAAGTAWVAVADLNGDGIPDIVTGNRIDDTVSVFLGLGDGSFAPPRDYAIGARVWRITIADVNNDGKPDILTANKGANTVSILLGDGDGTFQPQIVIPVGTRPGGVTVADVNGDGKPDLIVSNYADSTLWVIPAEGGNSFGAPEIYTTTDGTGFAGPGPAVVADVNGDGIPDLIYPNYVSANVAVRLGLGNGTFGPQQVFPAGNGAYSLKVLDVNGDGKPDLVVANAVDNSVSVLLGNGDGTFQPQKVYPVGFDPYSMTVADVNGDGAADIITANRGDNTVSVLLGSGDGTFQPEIVFPTGNSPRGVAAVDLNGDGAIDIVTASQGDDTANILFGNDDGTFASGDQQSAPAPNLRPFQVVVADVNGDGIPDIVTANRSDNSVSVLLGNPDGTFQSKETFATGRLPISVAVADLRGDGIADIVTANYGGNTVSVLLGNGDGTFQPARNIPVGSDPYDVKVADINGDGKPDIVVTNKNDNTVSVLLGNGDGTFQPQKVFPVASGPYEVVVDDLTGNGILDLVVSHFSATVVDVLLGNGNGTFQPALEFPVDSRPYGLAVADVSGDGIPDIVTSNYRDDSVSVLLGNGNGTFQAPRTFAVGEGPNEVLVADLNGDGKPDIVTANYGSDTVSVLLGNGDGTFQTQRTFAAGIGPAALTVADVNGDGKLDLIVANRNASTVNVLVGNGNGTFQAPVPLGVGKDHYSEAVADLNGDGNPDLVTTNVLQSTVTVQLGNGTGTFAAGQTIAVGPAPTSVAVADLNGDGRPDLVTANSDGNSVSVLLGNGDGTFSVQKTYAVGSSPRKVVVADVNGDGIPDLIVANYNDNTVSVLLGKGDGTFAPQNVFLVGDKPYSVAVADVNGDGHADLIVANRAGDTVSVLLGDGNSAFQPQQTFAVGRGPTSVSVSDVNSDGKPDIIVANAFDDTVSVLLGNGNGTFRSQQTFAVGARPYTVVVADVNGDGKPDVVTTNYDGNSVSVLLGNGNGTFQSQQTFAAGLQPVQTFVADVNGDGRPDLVTINNHDSSTSVLLGSRNGSFQTVTAASGVELVDTPFLVDLNGDGIPDSVVLDRSGNILFRQGLPGSSDTFAPPVILNPGRPARDITVVKIGSGFAIAAADEHFDPTLSSNDFVFTVSIYTVSSNGAVHRATAFTSTALPVRIDAADLTGNGLDALIVANSLDNSVSIALQTAPGVFAAPLVVPVGITPSDIAVADVNDDGLLDIVVSDQTSGDVSVLLNDAAHSFSQSLRFRAGTQLDSMVTTASGVAVNSVAESVSVVAGDFTDGDHSDLVVVNRGADSFTVLQGAGNGSFFPPQVAMTTSTSDGFQIDEQPGAVVAGDFNRDGQLDLAVLMQGIGQVWIYTGHGDGTFTHTASIPVGDEATGLSVVPGNGPALLDLLVGNGFGDVLDLQGKGDGTFQISGTRVSLSVVPDLLGPGQAGVLVGNQQDNRVTIQTPTSSGTQLASVQTLGGSDSATQLAPGDVQWFTLDQGATLPDPVVVSSGSNAVVVYRTTGVANGVLAFAPTPQTFFVGTAPASVTVADLNGDGIPDLVIANQGSNDVSVLFGSYDAAGAWVGTPGPRLKSGGDGPLAVTVRDMNGDGIPDLVVTNGGSGTLTLLPGVGQGFFDDQHAQTLIDFGAALIQAPTFVGDSAVGFVVTAAGDLLRFDLGDVAAGASAVFTGHDVVAARALATGQVVVALANGSVEVLSPSGAGLAVVADLQAQGGVPTLPSAVEVLQSASGQLQVLVTSQGSDTVFVFEAAVGASGGAAASGDITQGHAAAAVSNQTAQAQLIFIVNLSAGAGIVATLESAGAAATGTSASVSAPAAALAGLGGSSFVSQDNAASAVGAAVLVGIQGNNYTTVAILDFGFIGEEEPGGTRMPELETRHVIGDRSGLTRFVIGQDEASRLYRAAEQRRLKEDDVPLSDPWREDLFQRRPLPTSPPRDQEQDEALDPEVPAEQVQGEGCRAFFWDRWMDEPEMGYVGPGPDFEALTAMLAGVLVAQGAQLFDATCEAQPRQHGKMLHTTFSRDRDGA